MPIPTEPIGSIPRPMELIAAVRTNSGDASAPELEPLFDAAIRDTIARFEATESPVITDGEQRKYHNFWDYCVHGLSNMAPDGLKIPFAAGHTRRMPRLTKGPFRYREYGDNLALGRLSHQERERVGVHTCPGADRDSTHSAEVDYADLLPSLLELNVLAEATSKVD